MSQKYSYGSRQDEEEDKDNAASQPPCFARKGSEGFGGLDTVGRNISEGCAQGV